MAARGALGADGGVDFDKLESAMAVAGMREDRHELENAAKFRAVAQKVPTYEAFEDIVKAAHLKPMTEDVTKLELKRSSWIAGGRAQEREKRRLTEEGEAASAAAEAAAANLLAAELAQTPTTSVELVKQWEALPDAADRFRLLKAVGGRALYKMFKVDLGHELMGGILAAVNECYTADDAEAVSLILRAVVKTKRFDLERDFLEPEELAKGAEVVQWLAEAGRPEDEMAKLQGKFDA